MATKSISVSMTPKQATAIAALVMTTLLMVFLYDVDGAQHGMGFFSVEEKGLVVAISSLIGDLVWVIGIIPGILLAAGIKQIFFNDDIEDPKAVITDFLHKQLLGKHIAEQEITSKFWIPGYSIHYAMFVGVIGMASGFWFTGTLITLSLALIYTVSLAARKIHLQYEANGLPEELTKSFAEAELRKKAELDLTAVLSDVIKVKEI